MSKNHTTELSSSYQSFFKTLPLVAASPYIGAFALGGFTLNIFDASDGGPNGEKNAFRNGFGTCAALTVVPVLPTFTVLSCGIALTMAVIGGLSALITYPANIALDCHDTLFNNQPSLI
jgi:hypothetical protein